MMTQRITITMMTQIYIIFTMLFLVPIMGQESKQQKLIEEFHKNIYAEPPKQFEALNVGSGIYRKWSCPLPYLINNNITDKNNIINAMNYISNNTGWSFIERTDEKDYIHFQDLDGCWSYLGRLGGEQAISISNGCDFGAIVHEIAHAIGVEHEQSRLDRDNFVSIRYENIDRRRQFNFNKGRFINYGAYDFESIMHYNQWAFSINGEKTISLKSEPPKNTFIGQRYMLSNTDIYHLNKLIDNYNCTSYKREIDCSKDKYILTGGRNIPTLSIIYMIYVPHGKDKYRSIHRYGNEYLYLERYDTLLSKNWILKYNNEIYARTYNNNKWYIYSYITRQLEYDSSTSLIIPECINTSGYDLTDYCSNGNIISSTFIIFIIILII